MDVLEQIFSNPKYITRNPKVLQRRAKERGEHIPLAVIRKFLQRREAIQFTQQFKRPKKFNSIFAFRKNDYAQMDLMDLGRLSKASGFRYILNYIDVHTRYAVGIPLRNKSGSTVLAAFQEIQKKLGNYGKLKVLTVDKGKEFINKDFIQYINQQEIRLITSQSDIHESHKNGIVERFNRTMREKFYLLKHSLPSRLFHWHKYVDELYLNYNTQEHRVIHTTPKEAWEGHTVAHVNIVLVKSNIKVGSQVRLREKRKLFHRVETQLLSKQIFTVVHKKGYRYTLENENGVVLKRQYLSNEMKLIPSR